MIENSINFVYLENIVPWSFKKFNLENPTFTEAHWNDWIKQSYNVENCRRRQAFWDVTLQSWKDQFTYVFFITANRQELTMEMLMDDYHFRDKLVWTSKENAVNKNYPENGAVLKCWLFKFN